MVTMIFRGTLYCCLAYLELLTFTATITTVYIEDVFEI